MTDFIVDELGPNGLFAVFEDDGETGYLYVYEQDGKGVMKHLKIYSSARKLNVQEGDVQVIWSERGDKCGVVVWGGVRGIIDLAHDQEAASSVDDRQSPPITDPKWLAGF